MQKIRKSLEFRVIGLVVFKKGNILSVGIQQSTTE